jgi:hypothetical protein
VGRLLCRLVVREVGYGVLVLHLHGVSGGIDTIFMSGGTKNSNGITVGCIEDADYRRYPSVHLNQNRARPVYQVHIPNTVHRPANYKSSRPAQI